MSTRHDHSAQPRSTPGHENAIPSSHPSAHGQRHEALASGLFNREPPPEYLQEWTRRIATEKAVVEPGTQSVVIFRIGNEWLALPAHAIQEVTEGSGIHRIPHHRNRMLVGLVSVRGNLVVCASLGSVLGLEERVATKRDHAPAGYARLLIMQQKPTPLAFAVDEVFGVHRYHPRELKEVPATLANATAMYTTGLLMWREETVGCLDHELLLYTLNKGLL